MVSNLPVVQKAQPLDYLTPVKSCVDCGGKMKNLPPEEVDEWVCESCDQEFNLGGVFEKVPREQLRTWARERLGWEEREKALKQKIKEVADFLECEGSVVNEKFARRVECDTEEVDGKSLLCQACKTKMELLGLSKD